MPTPFIRKLQNMLESPEYHHLILWNDNKTAFEILNQEEFQKQALPLFFRHAKLPSFIRQLNIYGFKKLRYTNRNTYTHPDLKNGNSLRKIFGTKKSLKTQAPQKQIISRPQIQEVLIDQVHENLRHHQRIPQRQEILNPLSNKDHLDLRFPRQNYNQINYQSCQFLQQQDHLQYMYLQNQPDLNPVYFTHGSYPIGPYNMFFY